MPRKLLTSTHFANRMGYNNLLWILKLVRYCACSLHKVNEWPKIMHSFNSFWMFNGYTNLTFWHRSFTFNSNKSPTWCNNFSVYYPDICLQLNMFRAFSRPSSWAQWLQWQPLVLPTTNAAWLSPRYEGKTRGCHCSHLAPDDERETPKTSWAVNKRQDNKLKNCCIRLVIYLNCTMMHGLTNLKFYI